MSKNRRETPAKPPRRGVGGGNVREKKEKISKGHMNIRKQLSNKRKREKWHVQGKTPPWKKGGESTPSSSGCGGGGMIRKASEDPRAEGKGGGLMSVINRIDECK